MTRGAAALLALVGIALVGVAASPAGCRRAAPAPPASRPAAPLGTAFAFDAAARMLSLRGDAITHDASLLLRLDDAPLALPADTRAEPLPHGGVALSVPLRIGLQTTTLRIQLTPNGTELVIEARVEAPTQTRHFLRLRLELAVAEGVFAAGLGDVEDQGRKEAGFVTLHARGATTMVGVVAGSPLRLERFAVPGSFDETIGRAGSGQADQNVGLAIESPELALDEGGATSLQLALGPPLVVLGAMFRARGQEPLAVHGKVQGTREGAAVYATDDDGVTQARTSVDAEGNFELAVPKSVSHFFAANRGATAADNAAVGTSPVTRFEPGVAWPLLLSLEPSGTCTVQVFDGATQKPLTARVLVRGVGDTRDPWFGPDYRASGAGPLADVRDGTAEFELPAGTYKLQATHGPMYSIDEVTLRVQPGAHAEAVLRPRRVVPGLGMLSCDFHVHARPSYDSPVQTEDRVLSLVAAGVEFAVPTEHNVVGDYATALELTGQSGQLRFVPGVEVTTFAPKQGHFGVFPYALDAKVPPYRGTTLAALFAFVRRDPERVLIVHHPFLGSGMGYFDSVGNLAPERGYFGTQRLDFDAIELLNGYETLDPKRTEDTIGSWIGLLAAGHHAVGVGSSDSHRILYGWAGYPRTLVQLAGQGVIDLPSLQPAAVVRALKAGRAQATTGPVIELVVQGEQPGATVKATGKTVRVHVVVRASPWIDVTRVDLYVGGHVAISLPIDPAPLRVGPELGTDDEVFARSVRLVRDVELAVPAAATYVLAIARGEKTLEWVLPATALPPVAITNPVWVQ